MVCRSFLPGLPGSPGLPARRRGLPAAVLIAGSVLGSVMAQSPVAADPLRMSLTAKVSAPAKPALTIFADEPLHNLSIALEPAAPEDGGKPSGEAGMVKL